MTVPLLAYKPYDAWVEIVATAPAEWARGRYPVKGHSYCVMFCDEADVKMLKNGKRKEMEREIGCPIIPVMGDSVRQAPDFVKYMGGPPLIALDVPNKDVMWSYWPAYPDPYEGPELPRSGAYFCGRIDYPFRKKVLKEMQSIGVRMVTRNNEVKPYAEYARDLRSARAVVNFCQDRKTGNPQVKARVIEACLAGAVLLEQANPLTAVWLKPGEEYLEWKTLKDLQRHLAQMEADPQWGLEIARRGRQAVTERLTPAKFWERVINLAQTGCSRLPDGTPTSAPSASAAS